MTGTAHAAIGAGLGALVGDPAKAFIAGVLSHQIADTMPHKEAPPILDVPALFGLLGFLGVRYGLRSPQFWGAVGGVAPDLEHVPPRVGLPPGEKRYFPSHRDAGAGHDHQADMDANQILLTFLGGFLAEALSKRR